MIALRPRTRCPYRRSRIYNGVTAVMLPMKIASGGGGGPTFVQAATPATGSSVTSLTSNSINTTTGNTFVACVSMGNSVFGTFSDNKGNTYTRYGPVNGPNPDIAIWVCVGGTGGAGHTCTINISSAEFPSLHFMEFSGVTGVDTGSPWSVSTLTLSTLSLVSGTLNTSSECLVSMCASEDGGNPVSYAETTGMSVRSSSLDGSNFWTSVVATKSLSSNSAYTSTWTYPNHAVGMMIGLK